MPADTTASAHARGAGATPPPAGPNPSEQAERASGLRTIRKVAPYLWPDDMPWVKKLSLIHI